MQARSIWPALVALAGALACEDAPLEHPGKPRAPEQEGPCVAATFRATELEPLLAEARTAPLLWAGWTTLASDDTTLDVAIELDAEAVAEHPGCMTYLELPATLTLTSSDGLLALETSATVSARSPQSAVLSSAVPSAELSLLNEQLAGLVQQNDEDLYPLELRLEQGSLVGELKVRGPEGAAACDVAAWPEARLCALGIAELALDEPVLGVSADDIVSDLNALGALPLEWAEGTSSLALEVEVDGERYCLHEAVPDAAGKPSGLRRLELPVRVRVATADPSLDVWLPGHATSELDENGTRVAGSLRAHAIVPSEATTSFDLAATDLGVLELSLTLERAASQGELAVRRLSLVAPELVLQDISPACLSTELLGQLTDVDTGSW